MTPDAIRQALETSEALPEEALNAAVGQAAALAPHVIAVIEEAVDGVFLLPKQENLLFFGLHALAAAWETSACPAFLDLLRCPQPQLERLLGDADQTGLLLGLYDGNLDPLYEMLEDPATDGMIKWTLFQALARLTWEGRAGRERFVELLDRFDRDDMAPLGDAAWEGWETAVMLLGLVEFKDRVQRGWQRGRNSFQNEADRADWLERIERAHSPPHDPQLFLDDRVAPITDPVASLRWLREPRASETSSDDQKDPAKDIALNEREIDWLGDFLMSEQVPPTTLSLEHIDGLFTALVCGPVMVAPSEYMKVIWGGEEGDGPPFDSLEQAQFVFGLLMRHWNTIATRRNSSFPHRPYLYGNAPEMRGTEWAQGFILGVELRSDEWLPLVRDKKAALLVFSILALGLTAEECDESDEHEERAPEQRAAILEALPIMSIAIDRFWRDREALLREPLSERRPKVGRNEPCPCGSGRKYKKCCAAAERAPSAGGQALRVH
jgi:uncharacterized protein